jgi:hypothetical protein
MALWIADGLATPNFTVFRTNSPIPCGVSLLNP